MAIADPRTTVNSTLNSQAREKNCYQDFTFHMICIIITAKSTKELSQPKTFYKVCLLALLKELWKKLFIAEGNTHECKIILLKCRVKVKGLVVKWLTRNFFT